MSEKTMGYCMFCGTKLYDRELEGEEMIPLCDSCGEYRFPVFSTADDYDIGFETKETG